MSSTAAGVLRIVKTKRSIWVKILKSFSAYKRLGAYFQHVEETVTLGKVFSPRRKLADHVVHCCFAQVWVCKNFFKVIWEHCKAHGGDDELLGKHDLWLLRVWMERVTLGKSCFDYSQNTTCSHATSDPRRINLPQTSESQTDFHLLKFSPMRHIMVRMVSRSARGESPSQHQRRVSLAIKTPQLPKGQMSCHSNDTWSAEKRVIWRRRTRRCYRWRTSFGSSAKLETLSCISVPVNALQRRLACCLTGIESFELINCARKGRNRTRSQYFFKENEFTRCLRKNLLFETRLTFLFLDRSKTFMAHLKILKKSYFEFRMFSEWPPFWRKSMHKRKSLFFPTSSSVSSEIEGNASRIPVFNSLVDVARFENTWSLIHSHKKKSQGLRAEERGGHAVDPPLPFQRVPRFWSR